MIVSGIISLVLIYSDCQEPIIPAYWYNRLIVKKKIVSGTATELIYSSKKKQGAENGS